MGERETQRDREREEGGFTFLALYTLDLGHTAFKGLKNIFSA